MAGAGANFVDDRRIGCAAFRDPWQAKTLPERRRFYVFRFNFANFGIFS
jgi:hypothetical protein